jgi:hypothetical protein
MHAIHADGVTEHIDTARRKYEYGHRPGRPL